MKQKGCRVCLCSVFSAFANERGRKERGKRIDTRCNPTHSSGPKLFVSFHVTATSFRGLLPKSQTTPLPLMRAATLAFRRTSAYMHAAHESSTVALGSHSKEGSLRERALSSRARHRRHRPRKNIRLLFYFLVCAYFLGFPGGSCRLFGNRCTCIQTYINESEPRAAPAPLIEAYSARVDSVLCLQRLSPPPTRAWFRFSLAAKKPF